MAPTIIDKASRGDEGQRRTVHSAFGPLNRHYWDWGVGVGKAKMNGKGSRVVELSMEWDAAIH